MSYILNIETATKICSVAIGRNGELIALKETDKEKSHSSVITLLIQEVLKKADIQFKIIKKLSHKIHFFLSFFCFSLYIT